MTSHQLCFCHDNDKFYIYNEQLQVPNASSLKALPINSHSLFDYQIITESNITQDINTSSITNITSSSFYFNANNNQHEYQYNFLSSSNILSKIGHLLIDSLNDHVTSYVTLENEIDEQNVKMNAYLECIQESNEHIGRLYSQIDTLKSQSMPHWFISKFKTDWWLTFLKGGNKQRKMSVSCVLPQSMFNQYIYIHNDTEFDGEILHFGGGSQRLSTKYSGGSCPYSFVTWFFNNSQRLKSISTRTPQQYVNVYNCHFSYCNSNNKLTFTADITWKYTLNECHNEHVSTVWQKLCDTT